MHTYNAPCFFFFIIINITLNHFLIGLCPNWKKWDPQNKLKNVTRAMNIGEEMLGVSQVRRN